VRDAEFCCVALQIGGNGKIIKIFITTFPNSEEHGPECAGYDALYPCIPSDVHDPLFFVGGVEIVSGLWSGLWSGGCIRRHHSKGMLQKLFETLWKPGTGFNVSLTEISSYSFETSEEISLGNKIRKLVQNIWQEKLIAPQAEMSEYKIFIRTLRIFGFEFREVQMAWEQCQDDHLKREQAVVSFVWRARLSTFAPDHPVNDDFIVGRVRGSELRDLTFANLVGAIQKQFPVLK